MGHLGKKNETKSINIKNQKQNQREIRFLFRFRSISLHRTVYKCIDANHNVECCIKRIKLIETTTAAASTHFDMIQQEIYLLQNLMHPRIIHLYDYFYSNDNAYVYIVMELAAFGSLSTAIAYRRTQMSFFHEIVRIEIVCAI